jgi:hypothetical protein
MATESRADVGGLPFNPEVTFTNHKGVRKPGIEKRQTSLLKSIACVKPFLREGEEILLVTTACSPVSLLEQFLTGWILFYLKRCLLVFTNQRILHIPTTVSYAYRNSIAQIDLRDCASVQVKGRGILVRYGSGKKETFLYVAGNESRKLKALLPALSFGGGAGKRVHLCPRCTKELVEGTYTCPGCRLLFKDRAEAKRISLVYPGGGYFYTGHPIMGIGDAITEGFLLVAVILSGAAALSRRAGLGDFVVFGVVLAVEKATTVYHSNHFVEEFIPKEKDIRRVV